MGTVEHAILVAGGLGTRMLPASAAVAKEMLPLYDIPAMTHLAREAIHAGVKNVHIITSPSKDFTNFLGDKTWLHDKMPNLDKNLLNPLAEVKVFVHIQDVALGLGDAISRALDHVDGPFLVLLGDNLLMNEHTTSTDYRASNASKLLVDSHDVSGLPCVGLFKVSDDETSKYGVVRLNGDLVEGIVEKPKSNPPSNSVLCGRYLFTSDTKSLLEKYSVEEFGELQSIEIQKHWMRESGLKGVHLDGFQWYDSGSPLPWLKAQIDHALRRSDSSDELKRWLKERI